MIAARAAQGAPYYRRINAGSKWRRSDGAARQPGSRLSALGPAHLKSIVVVDDEPMLRSLVTRVLTDEGFAALEAPDGAAALELIESIGGEVALVIADIVMPRLTGIALLERLAVSHPGLPVLLMSGYSEAELADRGIAVPCGTLLKPFSSETLMAEVRRCLEDAA